ncbi:relaxase/mobilization nuclease domain-containing protein, partial [Planktothrix tepida]
MEKPNAELMMTNVASAYGELTDLAKAFRVTAATNPRVKKPVYHLSISPAQGDTLSTAQWLTLLKDLLKQRHLAEHQYIAVLHRDATYP